LREGRRDGPKVPTFVEISVRACHADKSLNDYCALHSNKAIYFSLGGTRR
jgi:hypothetical protein